MERSGLITICVGITIALLSSLPFMASIIIGTATPHDLAASLIWQGWALGGAVAFVGMILTMLGESRSETGHGAK